MTVDVDVSGFASLSAACAEAMLYDVIVPACEAKGIHLSIDGNMTGARNLWDDNPLAEYDTLKEEHKLFHVDSVQRAFKLLPTILQPASTFKIDSYQLKHKVEEGREYITNGDTIATMLLLGYAARFGRQGKARTVNCEFKAVYK